jgi:hypothetical protein
MDSDDDGMSWVEFSFWFFERYNLTDIIFLYLILQIVFLLSTFKFNESFNLYQLDASNRSWNDQLLIKPLATVFFICLFLFFALFYVSFLAFCYWGIIQWIPDVWQFLFSTTIKTAEFNSKLAIKDGILLFVISYLLSYATNRNLEVNDLRK